MFRVSHVSINVVKKTNRINFVSMGGVSSRISAPLALGSLTPPAAVSPNSLVRMRRAHTEKQTDQCSLHTAVTSKERIGFINKVTHKMLHVSPVARQPTFDTEKRFHQPYMFTA